MGRRSARATLLLMCSGLLLLGCSNPAPAARPTIGSPSATEATATEAENRATSLAREWDLTGSPLPDDWPDVPLPRGTEVVTAYAIGTVPRRTWTAAFTSTDGTALDMAEPVIEALRDREYVPIAQYVGAADTNTGLYSFAAPTFAIYVVLGEDDGQPNLVITVRGSDDESAGLPDADPGLSPRASATPSGVSASGPPTQSEPSP
jgi:hypothetical protein